MNQKTKIALGIIENNKNQILVIQRVDAKKGKEQSVLSWAFPGGELEKGESSEQAVEREVLEETGFRAKVDVTISERQHPQFPVYVYYIACVLEEGSVSQKIDKDILQIKWVKKEKLKDYLTTNLDPKVFEYINQKNKKQLETHFIVKAPVKKGNLKSTNKLTIYCDGACRGNPGPASAAFVVENETRDIIHKAGKYLGKTTNNVAEYQAVILALHWLLTYKIQDTRYKIHINLDSELLYKQITGQYKVKAEHLKPMHAEILQLIKQVQSRGFKLEFQHQLRDHNKLADELANQVLDDQTGS